MKGNIYLRKDGRFEMRYHYGYRDDGSSNYKSIYGMTEKEVKKKYKEIVAKLLKQHDLLIFDKNYLGYDINLWLMNAKIKSKKSTYSNYYYLVFSRIVPKFAKMRKDTISLELINNFTNELIKDDLSAKSINDLLIILQQILRFGEIDIKIPKPKIPKKTIQILKKEEQKKLEEALMKKLNNVSFGIYLTLYTGLRIGELCALRWEDIDLINKKILVKNTLIRIKNPDVTSKEKTLLILDEPKSVSSIREIPIPNFLMPIIQKISNNVKTNFFLVSGSEKMMEPRSYFNKYKKIMKELDLEQYSFHALRHSFATRCIENGCDPKTLSEILGHSNVKITLERYVHPNYENKVTMMNQLQPFYK